ncbi:NUDIX hydrolase [Thalassotalea sp. PLHSN55]|uniref:NUDIX hydrolase n=1 Tax=Thalassotalea sp. PLHSN55 TaxID=3435888 RepID=UPI003F84BE30
MDHGEEQFKPNTTVAAVIHHKNKFLLVEEIEHNQLVLNQPAGHVEANESLLSAIKREVFEETGLQLSPAYLCGIYYMYRADISLHFLRFCYVFELDSFEMATPQDDEIVATHWLTLDDIIAQNTRHRSDMVQQCINDYLSGVNIPLSSIKSNL